MVFDLFVKTFGPELRINNIPPKNTCSSTVRLDGQQMQIEVEFYKHEDIFIRPKNRELKDRESM